jgi:uncharacterized protein (DUF1684 family)
MSRLANRTGKYLLLAPAVAAIALFACGKSEMKPKSGPSGEDSVTITSGDDSAAAAHPPTSGYDSARVLRDRGEKDAGFKEDGSPIPEEKRGSFAGLDYFPINRALAFDLHLERLPQPVPFKMAATKGDVREMHRVGTFHFTVDGKPCALSAFTADEHPDELFVPFRDATNGTDTYEAGRYIDLPINASDRYLVDFNVAYNPYCAYNHNYTCPVVPTENILSVPIRAGEKLPSPAHE